MRQDEATLYLLTEDPGRVDRALRVLMCWKFDVAEREAKPLGTLLWMSVSILYRLVVFTCSRFV